MLYSGSSSNGCSCVESVTMNDDKSPKVGVSESIRSTISEMMNSVTTGEAEQDKLSEVGSYLHRVMPSLVELQSNPNPPPCLAPILQSLSVNINNAKELVDKCSRVAQFDPDEYMRSIIQSLQKVIIAIGDDLSKIPASAFQEKYVSTALGSLAHEMQTARLYANSSVVPSEVQSLADSTHMRDPRLGDFFPRESSWSGAEHIEPLYDTFFCPITKKIMIDPVTIESGITYEKSAILEQFEQQETASESLTCPVTGMKMESKRLNTNVALKATISEWVGRTEITRIRIAGNELLKGDMVYDAIKELKSLSQKKRKNIEQIHALGVTKILTKYLESMDVTIRCEALELLCALIQDDEGKEILGKTNAIKAVSRLISSSNMTEKNLALSFLQEATKSEFLGRIVGHMTGAILMLVTTKVNQSSDPDAAKMASEILKNMEKRPKNMKYMALNGYLDPLLTNLVEGTEEMQMEMVGYLSELAQKQDICFTLAHESRACEALIRMVRTKASPPINAAPTETEPVTSPIDANKSAVRKAAFDVLVSISSHKSNAMSLVDAGIVPVMVEELFLRTPGDGNPFPPKIAASGVLANLLESEPNIDPDNIQVNKNGHKLSSQYTMYNLAHMLKNSMPDQLNFNVVRVLLALIAKPKSLASIVAVARDTEMVQTIIELLDATTEELSVAAVKLLTMLCPQIGHTIADHLCSAQGRRCNLVIRLGPGRIREKHAEWSNFLAKLPHQNITFNLYLLHQGAIPVVVNRIHEILHGASANKYAKPYMQGLVGIMVRFTTTMYDNEILAAVMDNRLMHVFNELMVRHTHCEEVQELACTGIMNLSSLSINLSKPLEEQKQLVKKNYFSKVLSKSTRKEIVMKVMVLCPVHRGVCGVDNTFCIVEAGSVERLLYCLENENERVVDAALGALSTLLEDKVDIEKGVQIIHERDGVNRVLRVLREHKEESICYKAFWIVERCLLIGSDEVVKEISSNRALPSRLVSAFHSGDANLRKVADSILQQLHHSPEHSRSFTSADL